MEFIASSRLFFPLPSIRALIVTLITVVLANFSPHSHFLSLYLLLQAHSWTANSSKSTLINVPFKYSLSLSYFFWHCFTFPPSFLSFQTLKRQNCLFENFYLNAHPQKGIHMLDKGGRGKMKKATRASFP
jgi:hypothetical protein